MMITATVAMAVGIGLLVWAADRFVDGSAALARHLGVPQLVIGMVIVGFGTSAPEMTVSALAAMNGSGGIALGNAYGSNICNIALILGLAAIMNPIVIHSQVLRKELPILAGVTALAAWQVHDGQVTRFDAWILLAVFAAVMTWTVVQARKQKGDALAAEVEAEMKPHDMPVRRAVMWIVVGLLLLIGSSRLLVWGAVEVAHAFGVSDLIIGLTVVAVGTSLPELASSVIAAKKGEDDIALGNVIGSNLFNTLAVVGLAGAIRPISVEREVFSRDILVMSVMTASLFFIGFRFRKQAKISRLAGGILLLGYAAYTAYLIYGAKAGVATTQATM